MTALIDADYPPARRGRARWDAGCEDATKLESAREELEITKLAAENKLREEAEPRAKGRSKELK